LECLNRPLVVAESQILEANPELILPFVHEISAGVVAALATLRLCCRTLPGGTTQRPPDAREMPPRS
jgi:hypothetical protein